MAVGQSAQPFSSPRPRSIPTFSQSQNPNVVMAAWQAQIAANISNPAPQATPQNFTVTNSQGGLTLNWAQVGSGSGADGYEILKSLNGSFKSDLQIIQIPHPSQTTYFDNLGSAAKQCHYRIRTTSGTPQTPQSARGPESGVVAHTSIASGSTTVSTTVRDSATTDKSRAGARLGNYGIFKTPGSAGNSAAAASAGQGATQAGSPGTSAYDPAGAAAAAQTAAEAFTTAQLANYIPEAVISTLGDIVYGSAAATATVLHIGTPGQVLTSTVGGSALWSSNLAINRISTAGSDLAGQVTITASSTTKAVSFAANYTGTAQPAVVLTPTSDPISSGAPIGYWVTYSGSAGAWSGFIANIQSALLANITFNYIVIGLP